MRLCDTNVWLALTLSEHKHHALAREWLDTVDQPAAIHFCRATQQSFLRLLTNATVLGAYGNPPLTNAEAWNVYEELLADDRIVLTAVEPAGLEAQWKERALRETASPKLWMDSYLASFAHAGGFQLVTTDSGFRQFNDLDLRLLAA